MQRTWQSLSKKLDKNGSLMETIMNAFFTLMMYVISCISDLKANLDITSNVNISNKKLLENTIPDYVKQFLEKVNSVILGQRIFQVSWYDTISYAAIICTCEKELVYQLNVLKKSIFCS